MGAVEGGGEFRDTPESGGLVGFRGGKRYARSTNIYAWRGNTLVNLMTYRAMVAGF